MKSLLWSENEWKGIVFLGKIEGWMGLIRLYAHHSLGGTIGHIFAAVHFVVTLERCSVWQVVGSSAVASNGLEVYVFR